MKLSKDLLNNLIEITSNSAIACFPYIGKNRGIWRWKWSLVEGILELKED